VTLDSADRTHDAPKPAAPAWEPPRFQVISLDCEISAYAPDDQPLL
jgi:hypothetical protein